MRILAIDTGGNCGWALYDSGVITSGTFNLVIKSTKKRPITYGKRYVNFMGSLDSIGKVDFVFYENVVRHSGTAPAHSYGAYRAMLMLWCENNGVAYDSFDVGTIKKHATGKGNAKKDLMIEAARKTFKKKDMDDNEADALWILDLALFSHGYGSRKCKTQKRTK